MLGIVEGEAEGKIRGKMEEVSILDMEVVIGGGGEEEGRILAMEVVRRGEEEGRMLVMEVVGGGEGEDRILAMEVGGGGEEEG